MCDAGQKNNIRTRTKKLIQTYLHLLTLPFDEQDLDINYSITAAVTAICLAGSEGGILWTLKNIPIYTITWISLLIILTWMVLTAIFVAQKKKLVYISLHLNLASFWLVVTILFLAISFAVFPEDQDITPRRALIISGLLICVPIHLWRCGFGLLRKILYVIALLLSNSWIAILGAKI